MRTRSPALAGGLDGKAPPGGGGGGGGGPPPKLGNGGGGGGGAGMANELTTDSPEDPSFRFGVGVKLLFAGRRSR
jgi:hypothetical protein